MWLYWLSGEESCIVFNGAADNVISNLNFKRHLRQNQTQRIRKQIWIFVAVRRNISISSIERKSLTWMGTKQ